MKDIWPVRKLHEIANIRVSYADKKVHPREKPVKLCNYMDVYLNDYITSEIPFFFAIASIFLVVFESVKDSLHLSQISAGNSPK